MARTVTAAQQAVLALLDRSTHVRVKIDPGSGDKDLRTLEGWDWIEDVSYEAHLDSPVASATVHLAMRREYLNLSPFDDDSKLNADGAIADIGNAITIEVATMPIDIAPASADWVKVFQGVIDDVDFSKSPLSIKARDLGQELQDTYIETQVRYPADPDTDAPVEDIMQSILDDNLTSGVQLYSVSGDGTPAFDPGDSPGWDILAYAQERVHVMDALMLLANQIGWDIRYRWQGVVNDFKLVFYEPNRAASTPDWDFGTRYFEPTRASLQLANIRNVVKVTYGVAADRTSYIADDTASITKYGRRFMEIAEDAASQIDSVTEATAFAENVLLDLKEPEAEWEVPVPFFWPVELGDFVAFSANQVHFSSDQNFGVVSIRHQLSRSTCQTTLGCRGRPAGGFKRWIDLEARLGYNPAVDQYQDDEPNNLVAASDVGVLIVTYDDPRTMQPPIEDWAFTKVHVSTSGGFTPDNGNLAAIGRQTRFEIGGLVPGTTYYCKIVIVDNRGNESVVSTQVSKATLRSGPYHENNEREYGVVNPNSAFGISTIEGTFPDHWTGESGAYGSAAEEWESTTAQVFTGSKAIRVRSDGSGLFDNLSMVSRPFVVQPFGHYKIEWTTRIDEPIDGTGLGLRVEIETLDSGLSPIDTFTSGLAFGHIDHETGDVNDDDTWIKSRGWFTTTGATKYARIRLVADVQFSASAPGYIYFGLAAITRAAVKLAALGLSSDRSISASTWTSPRLDWNDAFATYFPFGTFGNIDTALGFTPGANGGGGSDHAYTVPIRGNYKILGAVALTAAMAAGKILRAAIYVNGSAVRYGQTFVESGAGNQTAYVDTEPMELYAGDTVTLQAFTNDSGKTIDDSECFLSVFQVDTDAEDDGV